MINNSIVRKLGKAITLPILMVIIIMAAILINQKLINFSNRDIDINQNKIVEWKKNTQNIEGNLIQYIPEKNETSDYKNRNIFTTQVNNNESPSNSDDIKHNLDMGINIHWAFRESPNNDYKIETIIDNGNIKYAREEFNWGEIEKNKGVWDFSRYDQIIDKYNRNNTKVLGLLAYSATWATTAPENIKEGLEFFPPRVEDWKNFVSSVVSRYKDNVYAWEIWNEPNDPYFFRGDKYQYFELLKIAHIAIKDIDPNALVISGGITWPDPVYTEEFFNNGMGDYIDGYGIHAYYCNQGHIDGNYNKLRSDFEKVNNVINKYNPHEKIWITELGCSSYAISENTQADELYKMINTIKNIPLIENIFWYCLRDTDIGDEAGKFGLINSSYKYKPAWLAWKSINE
jgi:GH35 family endo-1,4-beta-xylanase